MIGKFKYLTKMLQYLLIFALFFSAIHADGKFAVLQAPDSLEFQGEQPIRGEDVGEVILGSTGNSVNSDVQWTGLFIRDPFKLPTKAVVTSIEGATVDLSSAQFEVPLAGSGVDDSLDVLVAEMKASKISTCDIDYRSKHATKTSHKCFGHAVQSKENLALPVTRVLNSNDIAAKKFLASIADLNDAIDNYLKLKKTKDVELRNVVVVRISLTPIVELYGADSAEQAEALEIVKKTIAKLQKVAEDALFVAVSGTNSSKSRSKRQTAKQTDKKNPYNIAKFYSSDYPVIFNIILWFMVVFGLSLLAISYAIGSMDPGKDSIIYRMTSNRMKKDN